MFWFKKITLCLLAVSASVLGAQTRSRIDNPTSLSGSGWNVDTRRGALSMSIPLGGVNGPIPIPVAYRVNGGYQEDWYGVVGGAMKGARPVFGTLNFGFITDAKSFGPIDEPGLFSLEDGTAFTESDFVPFNSPSFGEYYYSCLSPCSFLVPDAAKKVSCR